MKSLIKHGGDIYKFAKKLHCTPCEIIDFSSNINTQRPTIKNIDRVNISAYADNTYKDLKKTLGKKYRVKSAEITLFNGGSSAIFELLRSKQSVTLYAPLYGEYKRACEVFNLPFKEINRFENIYEPPTPNSLVVFVNPATPDGRYYNLKKLFLIWKQYNCKVLIDESFLEFEDQKSFVDTKNPSLIVLKSLTKFYSCPGVRIGIIISHKKCIKKLEKRRSSWNLSSYDTAFIQEALKDKAHKKKSHKIYRKNKKKLKKILENCSYFSKVFKTQSNFFLCKLKTLKAQELQERLEKKKILIRDCSNFSFLDSSYVRFSVNCKKDIKLLGKALERS